MPRCKRGDDCSVALEGDCQKSEHRGRNLYKGVKEAEEEKEKGRDEKKESQEEKETKE